MYDAVGVIGDGCASDRSDLDGVDMIALSRSLTVDALISLDVLGEIGNSTLLSPLGIGLLVDCKVSLEAVFA